MVRLEAISKRFGTVEANRAISIDIKGGQIHALLGENGAGKSTLMGILAGRTQPDSGRILVDGRLRPMVNTKAAIDAGIGMVYQHFMLVEAMTVAENVFLGQEPGFFINPAQMAARVARLGKKFGLPINPGARVSDLSMGEKQRVEILRLLQRQSRILIFDEPTAVLTPAESEQLFDALRQMAAQGKAVVFISHKLAEVMALADTITILKKGAVVDSLPATSVDSRADLARRMVGREVLLEIQREAVDVRQRVLRIDHLGGGCLKAISLDLRQGEIVGIVGVAGNGQKTLVETVAGLQPPASGSVQILGKSWHRYFAQPRQKDRLSYIPEDRQGLASVLGLDLVDNFLLTTRHGFSSGPWLIRSRAEEKTAQLIADFKIHPPHIRATARQLSGGNLQKMVLAREFFRRPRLIVAEQPTQGLDIGAMEEVWNLLLKARERAGILLVTGDLNEALVLSDRIGVMFDGHIVDMFPVDDKEKVDRIGVMMAGVTD
ncbi:MAG: ABC transporter ATP-binding protein [Desulfobacterales bacterium]|nr:ABC transporter ATP-binding protein [Desulfobacterales bacterium]